MPEEIKIPINPDTEITQALKEFEVKSKTENDTYKAVKLYNETKTPKMISLVMKYSGGAIKEERQAEYVLLGFVVVAILVSLFLVFGGGGSTRPSPQALKQMKQHMPVFNSN